MPNKHYKRPISVCFIALGAYPLLSGKSPERVVGPDVNQYILGNELKNYDINIIFICYNEKISKIEIEYINNIKIIKIPKLSQRFPLWEYTTKTFFLLNAIKLADSDIYFHHIPGISAILKIIRKKSIYRIGSDAIVDRKLIKKKVKEFNYSKISLTSLLVWLELNLASKVIVQNEYQKRMLKKNFHRSGELIMKTFPIPMKKFAKKTGIPIILWVGSMAEVKQPDMFIELSKKFPETKFKMIGGHSGEITLYNKIKEASKDIPNLDFLGAIPFQEVDEYFNEASILVNTSLFEAYPNFVLIQAWINFLPVVSLEDNIDHLISKNNMGYHSKTFKEMVKDLKKLIEDEDMRETMGKNGRNYVENNHNIPLIIPKYIKLFNTILDD